MLGGFLVVHAPHVVQRLHVIAANAKAKKAGAEESNAKARAQTLETAADALSCLMELTLK